MNSRQALVPFVLSMALVAFQSSSAQAEMLSPRPISSPIPAQPTNASGDPIEGWVTVRYSVNADGSASNVRAINQMPPGINTAPTVEAVKGWTFNPGLNDGQAIDWHNNETVIVFRSSGMDTGAGEAFNDASAQIAELIESENLSDALEASDELIAENATSLADLGSALLQNALINSTIGGPNLDKAHQSILMVTNPDVPILSGTELFPAMQLRLQIERDLGRTYDAMHSNKRLARGIEPIDENPYDAVGQALETAWNTQPQLLVNGSIGDSPWHFDVHRPFFYIVNIDGQVDTLNFECDAERLSIPFDPDNDYGLPETFGDCVLFVHGSAGTTFSLVEALPPAAG